jgi:RNA polymerase sigma-B factor
MMAMGSAAPDPHAGPDYRARVIEQHLSLVESIARRHARRGEPLDDLVQAGCIGLIKAVDRFDPDRGPALSAFAGPFIEGEIRHHLRDGRRHAARAGAASLEAVEDGEDEQARSQARLLLARGWPALSARERRLLELRYFGDLTQADIAGEMGLSQAQVSRLLRASLDRLRSELDDDVAARQDRAYSGAEMAVPEGQPEGRPTHSGRLLVRMPASLHTELARTAEREGVSLNSLVTGALAGAVGWRDGAAADGRPDEPRPETPRPADEDRRHVWLPLALVANFAIVALAAVLAIVLLVVAWQGG